jgi:adenosylcobinamide kinase/adenosylcobinamide-phosphate guanylyltransferase
MTMGKIVYVTGGARSGKSTFAENQAKSLSEKVMYIATSEAFDEEMEDRIKKHIKQRPSSWKTVEMFSNFISLEENDSFKESETLLLDCLSLMVNNLIYYSDLDFENIDFHKLDEFDKMLEAELLDLIKISRASNKNLILVSNEIGMGIVPNDPLSRAYRDMLGRLNRIAQENSDEAYFLVSGIPIKLK